MKVRAMAALGVCAFLLVSCGPGSSSPFIRAFTPTPKPSPTPKPTATPTPTPSPTPTPTPIPIGTPASLGSNETDGVFSLSLPVITSQAAPAGSAIVVASVSFQTGAAFPPLTATCSDTAGNVYTTAVTSTADGALTAICSTSPIATQLSAGATVTVTWTGPFNTWNERVSVWSISGLAAAPLDQTIGSGGGAVGTAPTSGLAATTAQPNELLFGAITDILDTVTASGFSPGTNGSGNVCANTGTSTYGSLGGVSTGKNPPSIFGMYCIVSAKAAYAAQATLGSAKPWQAVLATYKGVNP